MPDLLVHRSSPSNDDPSTDSILNDVAQSVGLTHDGEVIHVTGDDSTFAVTKHEQEPWVKPGIFQLAKVTTNLEGIRTATEIAHLAIHTAKIATAAAIADVAAPFVVAAEGAVQLCDAWLDGDDLNEAGRRDAMHLALVASLDGLPDGFRQLECSKRPEAIGTANAGFHSAWMKMGEYILGHPELKRLLQAHCDDGMRAAFQAHTSNQTVAQFLDTHPEISTRYHRDAAFRAGFEAACWAKGHDEATYRQLVVDFHSRDARTSSPIVRQG